MDSFSTVVNSLKSCSFQHFANEAYANESGVAFRINPTTGKKEMFIAGTRTLHDWKLNFQNIFRTDQETRNRILDLTNMAIANKVDVIYGHSRGGALLADMPVPKHVQKIGLDAAMLISSNKNMLNISENGTQLLGSSFDSLLAKTGRLNVPLDLSPYTPHTVWATSPCKDDALSLNAVKSKHISSPHATQAFALPSAIRNKGGYVLPTISHKCYC